MTEEANNRANNLSRSLGDHDRYLEFNLAEAKFAIPLLSVKEVVAVPKTTKIPFSPDYFLGVMNLRGQVLSIIDLKTRMEMTEEAESAETAVIIIDLGYTHLGVVVDSINRVIALENEDFSPAPEEVNGSRSSQFITGCYKHEDGRTDKFSPLIQ